jgi:hypothetical protein
VTDPLPHVAEFVERHHGCGALTGNATEPTESGYLLSVDCSCGASFARWITPEDAALSLVHSALLATPN